MPPAASPEMKSAVIPLKNIVALWTGVNSNSGKNGGTYTEKKKLEGCFTTFPLSVFFSSSISRLPPNVNSAQVLLHYAVAYIGVHVGAIRRTLDRGTVLPTRQNNHVVGGNSDKKILMSPSISRAIALSKEKSFL